MLKDITLGQYYPVNSVVHKLDPRTKLFWVMVFVIVLFLCNSPATYLYMTMVLALMIISCKVPISFMLRGLKAILVLMIVAGLFNMFLTPGEPLYTIGPLSITALGIKNAVSMVIRMIYLIVGSSILTLTTTPGNLTEGLEKSLSFLKIFGVPVHEIALMMSIALRFIPILMEEADKIMKAQLARGADFETGSLIKRAKGLVPILVPLFVSAFKRANDLAYAMEARCYHGGEGRSRMYPLKYASRDRVAYLLCFFMVAGLIAIRILL